MCCVFTPAFRCLRHLKAGWTNFFRHFQPFLLLLKAGWQVPYLEIVYFPLNQKGWKRLLKKVFWPPFRCCKHLKAGRNTQHRTFNCLKPHSDPGPQYYTFYPKDIFDKKIFLTKILGNQILILFSMVCCCIEPVNILVLWCNAIHELLNI